MCVCVRHLCLASGFSVELELAFLAHCVGLARSRVFYFFTPLFYDLALLGSQRFSVIFSTGWEFLRALCFFVLL